MNASTLLDNFDLIADAPGGVPKLRELILQLAVRGKLVPQDPKDEPAELLLKRIGSERARLQKERMAHALSEEYQIDPGKISCDLPLGWRWVPLAVVFYPISPSDKKVKSRDVSESGLHPVVDQGQSFIAGYVDDPTKVIKLPGPVVVFGDHTRAVKFVDFDFVPGADGTKILRPILIDERYFVTVLRSYSLDDRGYGRHYKVLMSQMFPLSPLPEQKRIVAKVDELMKRCDELESRQKDRATRHKTLVASCLNALSGPKRDIQIINHQSTFNNLFSSPESIAELRKTILQLAVQGRLVPQDPRDEPAGIMLAKIKLEKTFQDKKGKLKADKKAWVGTSVNPPFALPSTWCWVRLQDVFEISRGGSPRPAGDPRYFGGSIPWITVGEITKDDGKYLVSTASGLTEEGSKRSRFIDPGDLLLTNSGATLGVPKISRIKGCMNDGVAVLRLFHSVDLNDFAYLYLCTQTAMFRAVNQGMGQPNLNTPIIAGWFFPLPPLSEQIRIVAKVNELMVMCDELESNLTQSSEVAETLAEAVVGRMG